MPVKGFGSFLSAGGRCHAFFARAAPRLVFPLKNYSDPMLGKYIIRSFPKKYRGEAEKALTLAKYYKYVSCGDEMGFCTHNNVRVFVAPEIDFVISSYGGVMTTSLQNWLRPHKTINLGYEKEHYCLYASHMKHALYPPISTNRRLRLVYIFGDPILSVLSIFRRNLQMEHYTCISGNDLCYRTPAKRFKMRSLKGYLASDLGAFPVRQHFHNWRNEPTQHPILFIRAETIWDHLEVLESFLGLPKGTMDCFPEKKERNSSHEKLNLSPSEREKLNRLYGEFAEEIKRMPDAEIRPADWFT